MAVGKEMKAVNIKDLYDADYSVIVINALKQYWKSSKRFNCIGAPKRYNILVYLLFRLLL